MFRVQAVRAVIPVFATAEWGADELFAMTALESLVMLGTWWSLFSRSRGNGRLVHLRRLSLRTTCVAGFADLGVIEEFELVEIIGIVVEMVVIRHQKVSSAICASQSSSWGWRMDARYSRWSWSCVRCRFQLVVSSKSLLSWMPVLTAWRISKRVVGITRIRNPGRVLRSLAMEMPGKNVRHAQQTLRSAQAQQSCGCERSSSRSLAHGECRWLKRGAGIGKRTNQLLQAATHVHHQGISTTHHPPGGASENDADIIEMENPYAQACRPASPFATPPGTSAWFRACRMDGSFPGRRGPTAGVLTLHIDYTIWRKRLIPCINCPSVRPSRLFVKRYGAMVATCLNGKGC